jgi:hypothetical protein
MVQPVRKMNGHAAEQPDGLRHHATGGILRARMSASTPPVITPSTDAI